MFFSGIDMLSLVVALLVRFWLRRSHACFSWMGTLFFYSVMVGASYSLPTIGNVSRVEVNCRCRV